MALTLAAGLVLESAPAIASTNQSQVGPIHIDTVALYPGSSPYDGIFIPGFLQIAFTNANSTPATEIVFAFESKGYVVDRFDDVGSFAQSVSIKHIIRNVNGKNIEQVAVEKATFADGTVWNNPAVAGLAARPSAGGIDVTKLF
jgi:hypothetical protein